MVGFILLQLILARRDAPPRPAPGHALVETQLRGGDAQWLGQSQARGNKESCTDCDSDRSNGNARNRAQCFGRCNAQLAAQANTMYNEETHAAHQAQNAELSAWNKDYNQAVADINGGMNALKDQRISYNAQDEVLMTQVTQNVERTASLIPPIENMFDAHEKATEKAMDKQEKDSEKVFKSFDSKAEKDLDSAENRAEKMLDTADKETGKEEKTNDRDLKKLEKKAEKNIAKEEKAAEKAKNKASDVAEKMDEKITEEEDRNTEIASHLAEVSDSADGSMEQAEAAQENALEHTENLNEQYLENLDKIMEGVQANGATMAGEAAKALQDSIKESFRTVEGAAEETGDSLDELRKQTATSVKETENVLKDGGKELAGAQKEQEGVAKKLEQELSKTKATAEDNKEKAAELLKNLKDSINELISRNKDSAIAEIQEHGGVLSAEISKKKDAALDSVTKGADQILGDADMNTQQIAEQFSGDFETMGNKLNKVQRDFDNTKNQVHSDAKQTESNIASLQKLDQTAGPELTKFAEQSIRSQQHIKDQAVADEEDVLGVLASSLTQATDQVKGDAANARKSISEAYNSLTAEADNAEEAIASKAQDITTQYAGTMKDVDAVLKPTEAQQSAAQAQLKQVNTDLTTINKDTQKMKEQYGSQLMGVSDRIMQAKDKIRQDTTKTFEDDEAYATQHMTDLDQQLGQVLSQQQTAFDQQAAGVGTSVKDAEEAEDVRRKLEMAKLNKLGNEINVQDNRVKQQEDKFIPEYQNMMALVQAAMGKIGEITKETGASREAFESDMREKASEKVAALQDETLKLLDAGVKQTSAQTVDLGESLKQQEQQAEAETQGTMKNIDGSLQNTVQLYKEIMGKVMKLEDTEKGVDEKEWLGRAQGAIALMQKDAVERGAQVSKLEAEYAKGEARANQEINSFEQDRASERSQFTNGLLQAIDGIEAKRKLAKEELDAKMQGMDSDARVASGKIDADQAKMQESITRGMDAVKDSEAAGLRNIDGMERQVDGKTAEEMRALNQMSLDTAKKRTQEQGEQAEVQRDLSGEQRAVGNEVGQMENAVGGMLKQLDPTAQLGVVTQSINSIQGMMDHAQETEQQKVSEVENDVKVTSNKIEKILAAANLEGGVLSKAVMATAMEVRDKLSTLKTQLAGEQQELRSLTQETYHTAEDLSKAHHRRIESLQKKMDGTRGQLENALGLQKYQSGEALEKVVHVLDKAIAVDDGLIKERDEVLMPSTNEWRGQVEKVFEGLNMALDLERVERMAAASLAAEESSGGGMMSAKEKMDHEIAMIQKKMQMEVDWVREKAQRMIAEIEADQSLSDAEKKARISAIRKQADADVYKLVMRTKKLVSDQYMSGHKLDEEMNELKNLLDRAKNIAGQGTAESAAWAKAMMKEVAKRLDSLRERYVNQYSFVQIQQLVHDASSQVDSMTSPTVQQRKAAFLEASAELTSMSKDRESENTAWNNALDALEQGAKLLKEKQAI